MVLYSRSIGMNFQDKHLPKISTPQISNNSFLNQGVNHTSSNLNRWGVGMITSIHGLKPGCSSCGKK